MITCITLFANFLKATTFRHSINIITYKKMLLKEIIILFLVSCMVDQISGQLQMSKEQIKESVSQQLSKLGLQGISMDSLSSGQKEQICDTMLSSYKTSGVSQEIQDVAVETINDVFGLTCGSSRASSTTICITVLITFMIFFLMK